MATKSYKRGASDTMLAFNDLLHKQEVALNFVGEEIQTLNDKIKSHGNNIDSLCDYISEKEKLAFYNLTPIFDIKNLEKEEKIVLVGILYLLANDTSPTHYQQEYIQSIQKYLNIKDCPSAIYLDIIENIENLTTQKAMYQTILEYLSLQDGDYYDETIFQSNLLDLFNLNKKTCEKIKSHVELTIKIVGLKGLSEKYLIVDPEANLNNRIKNKYKQLISTIEKLDEIRVHLVIECLYSLYKADFGIITSYYNTKGYCEMVVEDELRKEYDSIECIFNKYSPNAIDKKAYIEIKRETDPVFEEIRHHSQLLFDLADDKSIYNEFLNLTNIETFQKELQDVLNNELSRYNFSAHKFEYYKDMLEFDSNYIGFHEKGFLKLIEKFTAEWYCDTYPFGEIYNDVQSNVDLYEIFVNNIIKEKLFTKLNNKTKEFVTKAFPSIDISNL